MTWSQKVLDDFSFQTKDILYRKAPSTNLSEHGIFTVIIWLWVYANEQSESMGKVY